MDPALKAQYEFLSQYLIAQTQFQNANKSNGPAYSGKMYSLGWRKAFEENTKVGIQGISDKVKQDQLGFEDLQTHVPTIDCFIGDRFQSVSQPLFEEVKKHHEELKAPGLAPHFESDPDSFTSHLSFTIALPETLAQMAASKFLSDAAIQFKLGRAPPSESLTHSNSAARAFGHQV
ncbi:hypothetical protein PCASD_11299 [Puccinia coronata f. sp. avenae]|uniref:Tet-like 2OG-Fe(II) oxygenase domain-containing protein n=1 Tax=Puccinia coronata f. sp. avenae TaxID=200324 RepID=A0A2N5UJ92_9BASI|nr:hypothetical protein PCASD_11299 [Puccinia coronata f. sp. avenae]